MGYYTDHIVRVVFFTIILHGIKEQGKNVPVKKNPSFSSSPSE